VVRLMASPSIVGIQFLRLDQAELRTVVPFIALRAPTRKAEIVCAAA
jgi:hypothetical protein